jgi:type I restriction enzyme S subunit
MNNGWATVPLGEVVSYRKEFATIDDAVKYKRCRVRVNAQGIVLRDVVSGREIKTKQQQICRSGEFLVAEIDAKVGGFGIIPDELDGAIVSSHYYLFVVNKELLDERFLDFFIRTPRFRDQVTAQGSTNYAAIRPNHVLSYKIPLPSLTEQQHIVNRIEELAAKIAAARRLRQEATLQADTILQRELASIIRVLTKEHGSQSLGDLIIDAGYGTSIKCTVVRTDDALPVLRIPNVALERINFDNLKYGNVPEAEARRVLLKKGDILIVRTNGSAELIGRCAVVSNLLEPTAFASYLIRIACNQSLVHPDYLQLTLKHLRSDGQLFDLARTTAGQYNVSLGRLRAARLPVPSLPEQKSVLKHMQALQSKLDSLKQLQSQTATELDAMLPAVLDKAFKGEL